MTSDRSEFRSWLFEGYCNEILIKGGKFALVPLSQRVSARESTSSINLEIPLKSYVLAEKNDFESIDGDYYDEHHNTLYLFQTTTRKAHPVKARAILNHLESMNLSHIDGLTVNLVFVVPKGIDDFMKQEILCEGIIGEEIATDQQLQLTAQTSQNPLQRDKRKR